MNERAIRPERATTTEVSVAARQRAMLRKTMLVLSLSLRCLALLPNCLSPSVLPSLSLLSPLVLCVFFSLFLSFSVASLRTSHDVVVILLFFLVFHSTASRTHKIARRDGAGLPRTWLARAPILRETPRRRWSSHHARVYRAINVTRRCRGGLLEADDRMVVRAHSHFALSRDGTGQDAQ